MCWDLAGEVFGLGYSVVFVLVRLDTHLAVVIFFGFGSALKRCFTTPLV